MVYKFANVHDSNGKYYFNDSDINYVQVPLAQCEGDYILTKDELRDYFGVDETRFGTLPQYLIFPHLDAANDSGRTSATGKKWYDITGLVIAYEPVEWVPIVKRLGTVPKSVVQTDYSSKTVTVTTNQVYGSVQVSASISAGKNIGCVKMAGSASTDFGASYSMSTTAQEEVKTKATYGDRVVQQLSMGLSLRVRRKWERSLSIYGNPDRFGWSMTWDGGPGWDDIAVANSAVSDVSNLMFSYIPMTVNGDGSMLWLQTLPAFDKNKKLTDLNLVLSCGGWTDWYVYTPGTSGPPAEERIETIPVPGYQKPLVTLMTVAA